MRRLHCFIAVIFCFSMIIHALPNSAIAGAGGVRPSSPAASGSGSGGGYKCNLENPEESTLWGCCQKEPKQHLGTACLSPFDFFKYSTLVEFTDDKGNPVSAIPLKGEGAASPDRVQFNPYGSNLHSASAKFRIVGDDGLKKQARSKNDVREQAYPVMTKKEDNECKWYTELDYHVTNTVLGGASTAEQGSGRPQVRLGTPEALCMSASNTAPRTSGRSLNDSHTNKTTPAGPPSAEQLMRHAGNPDADRTFACAMRNSGCKENFTGNMMASHQPGGPGSRESTTSGFAAFAHTPAYAAYDPHDFRPGEELKIVQNLLAKTPEEVAQLKADSSIKWYEGKYAYAAGQNSTSGNINGIVCGVHPRVCASGAVYDKQPGTIVDQFFPRFPRDNKVSTPQFNISDEYRQLAQGKLGDALKGLAGGSIGSMLEQLSGTAGGGGGKKSGGKSSSTQTTKRLSEEEIKRCVNALRIKTEDDSHNALLAKETAISQACREDLLACLQGLGGYSEYNLTTCYDTINAVADASQSGGSSKGSGGGGGGGGSSQLSSLQSIFSGGGGINAGNLSNLGGADIGQLNDILMQKIPGLNGLGSLMPTDGKSFGAANTGQMAKLIEDFKTHATAQIMDGSNAFPMRAALTTWNERDSYSPCAMRKNCMFALKQTPFNLFTPYEGPAGSLALEDGLKLAQVDTPEARIIEKAIYGKIIPPANAADIQKPPSKNPYDEILERADKGLPRNVEKEKELIDKMCSNDDPTDFGPCPSHKAIGMPETNEETGALLFREDGTAYYANLPDVKVNFEHKELYTVQDVKSGMLPQAFASVLPLDASNPEPQIQFVLDHKGHFLHMPKERVEKMVAEINREFAAMGSNAVVNTEVFEGAMLDLAQIAQGKTPNLYADAMSAPVTSPEVTQMHQTLASLGIGDALAAIPAASAASSGLTPPSAKKSINNATYCAGKRLYDQFLTDMIKPRFQRFNAQLIMRILYNRWLYADLLDPARCTPDHVCAPKPCGGSIPGYSPQCWTSRCIEPSSPSMPPAKTQYDTTFVDDIAYARPITHACKREDTPRGKPLQSRCHYYEPGCMTRAYNSRVYPNGKRYWGTSWSGHPDNRYLLDKWAMALGADNLEDVGENVIMSTCNTLAEPMPDVNRMPMVSLLDLFKMGSQALEGTSFVQNFGFHHPYPIIDSTGAAFSQAPGQKYNYRSPIGALVAFNTGANDPRLTINSKYAGIAFTPQNSYFAQKQSGVVSDALAQAGGASAGGASGGSVMPCYGGVAGNNSGSCPVSGYDPQLGTMTMKLAQARLYREYGVNCYPRPERVPFSKSPEVKIAELCGASYMGILKDVEGGKEAGMTKTFAFPLSCPGNNRNDDPKEAFGSSGIFEPPQTGMDAVYQLGDKAGGCNVVIIKGCGGEGNEKAHDCIGVVREVNKEKKMMVVDMMNHGRWCDVNMICDDSTRVFRRNIYEKLPEYDDKLIKQMKYPTKTCAMPAKDLDNCETKPDLVTLYKLKDKESGAAP